MRLAFLGDHFKMRFCVWPGELVAAKGTGGLASLSAAGPCWVAGIRVAGQKVALRILRWRGPICSRPEKESGGNTAGMRHCKLGYVEG